MRKNSQIFSALEDNYSLLMPPRRYVSPEEDNGRWEGFSFRESDIVVSARSKHGTTWIQTILLLLVHQQPNLPAPLAQLSPWLDHLVEPLDAVVARLEVQDHRRVIKTHTPLDGVPLEDEVTYIVVARHPLDAAVSLYYQSANIDRERLHQLVGIPTPERDRTPRPPVDQWLRSWIDAVDDPAESLDSLSGVMWHLSDAWKRRREPNILLVHYDELLGNLSAQMRRLADRLAIEVPSRSWNDLVEAATFRHMRARADRLVPDPSGILRDKKAFFRQGRSGAARGLLGDDYFSRYLDRASTLAPIDLLAWLHNDDG